MRLQISSKYNRRSNKEEQDIAPQADNKKNHRHTKHAGEGDMVSHMDQNVSHQPMHFRSRQCARAIKHTVLILSTIEGG